MRISGFINVNKRKYVELVQESINNSFTWPFTVSTQRDTKQMSFFVHLTRRIFAFSRRNYKPSTQSNFANPFTFFCFFAQLHFSNEENLQHVITYTFYEILILFNTW